MSQGNKLDFYVYIWLREDGTPYYVGKGCKDRAFKRHRIGLAPPRVRIIIQHFLNEDDAFEAEKFLIAYYGREDQGTGRLLNLTDGGENPPNATGLKRRPESIKKSIEKRQGFKHSRETRAHLSQYWKGRSRNKGIVRTPEQKAKIRATILARGLGFKKGYTPWNKEAQCPKETA